MTSKYLNTVLTVIAVLLALNLWVGVHQSPAAAAVDNEAMAQGTTTAGQQRSQMIEALGNLNTSVEQVNRKLGDGSVRVQVTSMPEHD